MYTASIYVGIEFPACLWIICFSRLVAIEAGIILRVLCNRSINRGGAAAGLSDVCRLLDGVASSTIPTTTIVNVSSSCVAVRSS